MTRRELLIAAAAGSALPRLYADPLGLPIGTQLYPVRDQVGKDFPGTLRHLAGMGYRTIEMCSPPGYVSSGFGPLANLKAPEMRRIIEDAGLRCESCHYNAGELRQHLDERIAFAKELGLSQMILSTFGLPNTATLDDWTRAAADLNKTGEAVQKAGMQLGFHNHNNEFKEIDGTVIYDRLMSTFDPKLVRMQFQVAVISLGFEAATYFKKYPGRFLSMHLADYSTADKKTVAVGAGVVDWKSLFAAAKTAGIKNYFVEVNPDLTEASFTYLHSMKV
jgi:sugar phosphate isomerase/epimerase